MISETIINRISELRRTIRTWFIINGLGRVAWFIVLFCIGTFLIDRFIPQLPAGVRLFFLVVGIVIVLYFLWRHVVYPVSVPISDDDIALCIERQYPDLKTRLISSVQLSRAISGSEKLRQDISAELVGALIRETNPVVLGLDFKKIIDISRQKKLIIGVLGILIVIAFYISFYPQNFNIWLNRLLGGDARWPKRTELVVEVKDLVVPKGTDVPVTVIARKGSPARVYIHYQFDDGAAGQERMKSVKKKTFNYSFIKVIDSFRFYVTGGDDQTKWFNIKALTPPAIEQILLCYDYPDYTNLPDTDPNQPVEGGMIKAPVGTKVRFSALINIGLLEARMLLGKRIKEVNQQVINLKIEPDQAQVARFIKGEIEVLVDSEYELQFKAENRLRNAESYCYPIKAVVDNGPLVRILEPKAEHKYLTPVAVLPLQVLTKDDYGINEIALLYKMTLPTAEAAAIPTAEVNEVKMVFEAIHNNTDYGSKRIETNYQFAMSPINAREGTVILYSIEATDNCAISSCHKTRSREYRITVVSKAQLEKKLEEKEMLLKEEVKKLAALQKREKSAVATMIETLGDKNELTSTEKYGLTQSLSKQRRVTQGTERVVREFEEIITDVIINKLWDAGTLAKLTEIKDSLKDIALNKSPRAGELLAQAGIASEGEERQSRLDQAQLIQDEILRDLWAVLNQMQEWEDYQEVVRLVRELKEKQKRIIESIKKGGK